MTEYKVVKWNVSLMNNTEKLEDILNEHARKGWRLLEIHENYSFIIFEKDKNR